MRGRTSFLVFLAIGFAFAAITAGCSDDSTDARTIYTLTYTLSYTGESTVDEVTYSLGGGDVTLQDPPDGWSVEFPGGNGQEIGASAVGTAKNGTITLTLQATTAGQAPINGQDTCTESAGIAMACSLTIAKITLP